MTDTLNIYQRLAKAMDAVKYVQKERKQGMQYTIVSHDAVTAKVRPALLEAGIVYHPIDLTHTQNGNRCEVALTVRFASIDDKTDFFDVPSLGYGVDNQDKGPGKAISYAVKYALLKALGLETGDDADHDSIDHQPTPKQEPKSLRLSKEDARAIYDTLNSVLQNFGADVPPEELLVWGAAQSNQINALPEDWEKQLRADFTEALKASKANHTKEAA